MSSIKSYMPFLAWAAPYDRANLPGDGIAGLITAILLVPQGMAYAMLAGLPPQVGLYASIIPLLLYALFGTSRTLAVGPVAIVSLMTASALSALAPMGLETYIAGALILALLSGAILILAGMLRGGFLVNFLSHPVITGFTSAAAIVIALSQMRHILGVDIPRLDTVATVIALLEKGWDAQIATVIMGFGAIALLLLLRGPLARYLRRKQVSELAIQLVTQSGPLAVVLVGTLATWVLRLDINAGVGVVGEIPKGLPSFHLPVFKRELWESLAPAAALIAFVGYLESVSVAKALAARRRQKIDPNQELIGLGIANIGAGLFGGYPVGGGFGRSMVNFNAGANTPVAAILSALLVAVSVALLTPLFYFLPRCVLAAIIVVAVASLVDVESFRKAWRYMRGDALAQATTFLAVLLIDVETGIITGIALSIMLYLWRSTRPHYAIVGQVGDTEHYRNVKRHTVRTDPEILLLRVDENLYFANAAYLETTIQELVADNPDMREIVLICSAINVIDASALETLENIADSLRAVGVTLHLAEVKGPVMDRLNRSTFLEHLQPGQVFLSTHEAVKALRASLHQHAYDPVI